MANKFKPPVTNTATRTAATPVDGELLYDSDTKSFYSGDGTTLGGKPVSSSTFVDNLFRIQDNGDSTKQIAFEASGITTGTTRTITVPNTSGTMALTSDLSNYTTTATKTSNYTANNLEAIPCNTSGGAFTITTPASGKFKVIDIVGTSPTTGFGVSGKEVTISGSSGNTVMGAATLVLNVGSISPEFELIGTDWRIINHG